MLESHVELPDGRVVSFRGVAAVGLNLAAARRLARRGVRARRQAVEELFHRGDGTWQISDPGNELDLMSDLAGAVLFAYAAVERLAASVEGHALEEKLHRLRSLHDALLGRTSEQDPGIFGRLIRGDADTCADDAIALVEALRPELLSSVMY